MHSHHGCLTCRHRKLKCDEIKPACGQCTKSGRRCVFSQDNKFRHFDVQGLFRQGHEDTAVRGTESEGLFDKDQIWIDIPNHLIFVNIANPFEHHTSVSEDEFFSEDVAHGREYRNDIRQQPQDNIPTTSPSQDAASEAEDNALWQPDYVPELPHNLGSRLGEVLTDSVNAFESACSLTEECPNSGTCTSPIPEPGDDLSVAEDNNDPEANILGLQLLRHFREGPGQWMDLFDTSAHFSSKVTVRAATKPLLKSAICALAAKHLLRTHRDNSEENQPTCSTRATSSWAVSRNIDWQYKSVKYYHRAIRYLKGAIASDGCNDTRDLDGDRNADTFAAVAILCMYELMDAPGNAWKAHLTALPLYSTSDSDLAGYSPVSVPQAPIKGPVFWSLARQDFLCAFISETRTRLNLDHVQLWQNFGLATDENGLLLPFSPLGAADLRASMDIDEDSKSNELLWLLGKVVNLITSGDGINPEDYSRPAGQRMPLGVTQELLLQRWEKLKMELQAWYESLPSTFTSSARTKLTPPDVARESAQDMYKIWYDIPLACILLLVNRPQESTAIRSTVSARLRSYRLIQREVLRHGKEICGISLAEPPDAVRIHSVLPLFVAGQSFYERTEQGLVLKLLSSIETELGWATRYQIQKLIDEWKVNADDEEGRMMRGTSTG